MNFKNYEWRILWRVVLLCVTITGSAYLLAFRFPVYLLLTVPIVIFQILDLIRHQRKAHDELGEFVESVHYRDFSRYFDVKHAPAELQPLRKGFNEINTTFKVISKEKETQYQYLQKILELVDTGILSYETESGNIVWMNESLKKMLQLPYLKTIHSLERRDPQLYNDILSLKPGEGRIANAHIENTTFKVLLSVTAFQTDGQVYKLVAFQNVNEALDETEAKAWQKLLGVMTHEIMNSIAPISSLADTLKQRLKQSTETEAAVIPGDLEVGIDTIKRRSEGLLKFAETYRNLNRINKLNLQTVYLRELFGNLLQLMQPTLEQKEIEFETIIKDTELQLNIDPSLIEQVLINLVVNAMDALKDTASPRIVLSAYISSNNKTVIKIADNGPGMSPELEEKIFIPFFSTKKNGSGIGLSLCKQIMMLHKGNIQVQTEPGKGTGVLLQF